MTNNMKIYNEEMISFAYRERAERIAKEIEMHFKYFDEDIKMPQIINSSNDRIDISIKSSYFLLDDIIDILDKKHQFTVIRNDDGSFMIIDINQNSKTVF